MQQAREQEPIGMPFRGPRAPWLPGLWRPSASLAMLEYMQDPVRMGLRMRPSSGRGVVSTARGHATLVVLFGDTLARTLFTDLETWLRPTGGLVHLPPSSPNTCSLMRTIVLMNGSIWQKRRRIAVPPTHKTAVLDAMRNAFVSTVDEIASSWRTHSEVDISNEMLRISLRNNVRCLIGLEPEAGEPVAQSLGYFTETLVNPAIATTQRVADWCNRGNPIPMTPYAKWVELGEHLYSTLLQLVRQRRAKGGANDLLGALIEARDEDTGDALSDDDLVGELGGLYAAGFETTAHTLAWTLWLLAAHPSIARDVQDEVSSVLRGDAPTVAQSQQLPLLDAAIREAQRIMTVVPSTLPRITMRDCELEGVPIPRGTTLVFSCVAEHRNPDFYPQPTSYLPSRWDALKRNPNLLTYRFLPFGAGPRRCLGGVFADYQIRTTLALLLQRFAFQPHPTAPVHYRMRAITLAPSKQLPLFVSPLGQWTNNSYLPQGNVRRLFNPV